MDEFLTFLLCYFTGMVIIAIELFRLLRHFERRGKVWAQWVVVGVSFILIVAHWSWPFITGP